MSVIADTFIYTFPFHGKDINIPPSIVSIVAPVILFCMFYVAWRRRYGVFVLIVCILQFLFGACNFIFVQKNDINSYTQTASSIPLLLFCVIYFYRLLIDLPAQHLHKHPMFWICTAILIYNAGTLFLSIFTHYLVEVLANDFVLYGNFTLIMAIIQQLVVLIGLWQDLRNIKSHSSSLSAP
jgi:hypothetical protein